MRSTLSLLFLAATYLTACGGDGAPAGPGTPEDAGLAAVEVVAVQTGSIRDGVEGTATVEARERAGVRSQVSGVVASLAVEEGSAVQAGDILAQIDRPSSNELRAQAVATRDKAAREASALEKLAGEGLVPGQQLVEARFALKQARIELERLDKEQGLEAVRSPIAGVVTARHVQPGEAVSVGAALFEVADVNALEVALRLPERHLPRLVQGQPVELFAEGAAQDEAVAVPGRVDRIAPTVDARSGTVKVSIALTPPAPLAPGAVAPPGAAVALRPGMYVRARIIVDVRDDALLLPKRALLFEEERAYAFRVETGPKGTIAHKLRLTLGYQDRERVQVGAPLAAGDTVVVFGQRGLADGAAVRVVEAPHPDGGLKP